MKLSTCVSTPIFWCFIFHFVLRKCSSKRFHQVRFVFIQVRFRIFRVFCSIFRDLQDLHTFAPLRSQNFSKKVVTILSFLNIWIIYSFNFLWKTHENWYFSSKSWWNFVGISRTSSENVNICGELQKILKKLQEFGQNPETNEITSNKIIHSFEWIIQSPP